VGLKPLLCLFVLFASIRSNRTIVGLKQHQLLTNYAKFARSNRTIVGLKLCKEFCAAIPTPSSNRTIVGLKHTDALTNLTHSRMQQSHHCGIETALTKDVEDWQQIAAIAPLWD